MGPLDTKGRWSLTVIKSIVNGLICSFSLSSIYIQESIRSSLTHAYGEAKINQDVLASAHVETTNFAKSKLVYLRVMIEWFIG